MGVGEGLEIKRKGEGQGGQLWGHSLRGAHLSVTRSRVSAHQGPAHAGVILRPGVFGIIFLL